MDIGIVKEVKNNESRVSLTPESCKVLSDNGINVYVQSTAGINCGFSDQDYIQNGGIIVGQKEVWECPIILKVKEPQESEYKFFKKDQVIWGFLHLAANPRCVEQMIEKNITAIASETIKKDGRYNLLSPVSVIAGRRSVFTGINFLEYQNAGRGILLPGIDENTAGNVVIFGGGVVGEQACKMALGIGCNVVVIEKSLKRCQELLSIFDDEMLNCVGYSEAILYENIKKADLFISTILIPGSKPPKLVLEYMVKDMKKGSVIVDVSIDQGGCVETINYPTTHDEPIFIKHGVVHYAVANMPGAVPVTATYAIQGAVEYLLYINEYGIEKGLLNKEIISGIQVKDGIITNENLKKSLDNI